MTATMKFSEVITNFQMSRAAVRNGPVNPRDYSPSTRTGLNILGTLPQGSILFGMAEDGKPLLLSLTDPHPGSILVTAERACGKTHFLKMLIQAAALLKQPGEVEFFVLTCYPQDFAHVDAPNHLQGVWSAEDESASELIYEIACRVETPAKRQPTMLLIDGLDAILQLDPIAQKNLAYILEDGPQAMVWPVLTANANMIVQWPDWLACFHTRIYGRVSDPNTARDLTPNPGAPLNRLLPGTQFCMREKSQWLKFWLPTLPA